MPVREAYECLKEYDRSGWKETFGKYAEEMGISVEAYGYLFMKHQHDPAEPMPFMGGAAVVMMTTALEALKIEQQYGK